MTTPISSADIFPRDTAGFGEDSTTIPEHAARLFDDNTKAISKAYALLISTGRPEYGQAEQTESVDEQLTSLVAPSNPQLPPPTAQFSAANLAIMMSGLSSQNAQETMTNLIEGMRNQASQEETATDVEISKLQDQLNQANKAHKSGLFGEIFGWIAVAVIDIAAIVAVVGSFGAATPLLVAAVMATTMMTLQQTGAMTDIVNGVASLLQDIDPKLSSNVAHILAVVLIGVALIAAQICLTAATGGAALPEEVEEDSSMIGSVASDAESGASSEATTASSEATGASGETSESSSSAEAVKARTQGLFAKYGFAAVNAALGAGQGVSGGMQAYYESLEEKASADALDYKKYAQYLETIIANNQQAVVDIINTLNSDFGFAGDAIKSQVQTDQQLSQHMAPRA